MTEATSEKHAAQEPVAANTNEPEILSPEAEDAAGGNAELLKAKDEEIARLKDMYLRAAAETENVRTRARREQDDTAKYAVTKFARDMVAMVETLAHASASVTPEARNGSDMVKRVGEGLDMTMQELLNVFERNGIKRINPLGEKFDHNFHQAVAQVENAEAAPGTVLQVLQAGYALHDRLLRPAMVTVSTQAGAAKALDTSA